MAKLVAFLRGIGLGKRRPPMVKLAQIFEAAGYKNAETFIASGNVIFESTKKNLPALERDIQALLRTELGYEVPTFVRPAQAVIAIADSTPFPDEDQEAINVHVAFLEAQPSAEAARALESVRTDYDRFKVDAQEFYWLCRGNMSASTVWDLPEVKRIKIPNCTLRNMTSVRKLTEKHLRS